MSALNEKIDNLVRGSVATPVKLTTYVMYGLGSALFHIYNAYLCLPTSIKWFLSSACGRS